MTLTISLPKDLEQRLIEEAKHQGISLDVYATKLLNESLLSNNQESKVVKLVQSWIDEDDSGEQQETADYLINALDKERSEERQLFPPNLKGITW